MPPTMIRTVNPFTERVIGTLPTATAAETRAAVKRAREAQPAWAAKSVRGRVRLVERVVQRLAEAVDDMAPILTQETGKPITEARSEIGAAQRRMRHVCGRGQKMLGGKGPKIEDPVSGLVGTVVRNPIGVAGIITAWNYPVSVSCQVIASALIAGNTVVFKPSEMTALTGKRLGEVFDEFMPPGVMITIDGAEATGRALVNASDVVGFVGSCAVGQAIMRAGAKRMTRLALELGGKDPAIICHDADLPAVAKRMIGGALYNCGQECNSVERIYIDRRVEREFLNLLVAEVRKLKVGDPMRESTTTGPMISARQRRIVESHVADAVRRGAKVRIGGRRPKRRGFFYQPTVLSNVDHSMRVMTEETFGPVIPVMAFDSEDEAIGLANDTPYGLTGSVWTRDIERGKALAMRIEAGQRGVNTTAAANPNFPWGGSKMSGIGRLMGPDPFVDFVEQRGLMVRV